VTQLTHAIDRRPYGRWHARDAIIRPIRASDKRLPERGMRRLSPESARLRFLGPKDHLTLAELRYLTEIDYVDHYAVVAVAADDPRELLGVGRWVRDPARPFAAELAIAVGDCYQGRGLGTALGEALSRPRALAASRSSPRRSCRRTFRRSACSRACLTG
jgi:GNAT superfamily N-acetyltransferase